MRHKKALDYDPLQNLNPWGVTSHDKKLRCLNKLLALPNWLALAMRLVCGIEVCKDVPLALCLGEKFLSMEDTT